LRTSKTNLVYPWLPLIIPAMTPRYEHRCSILSLCLASGDQASKLADLPKMERIVLNAMDIVIAM